jgi:hypothetical protein
LIKGEARVSKKNKKLATIFTAFTAEAPVAVFFLYVTVLNHLNLLGQWEPSAKEQLMQNPKSMFDQKIPLKVKDYVKMEE